MKPRILERINEGDYELRVSEDRRFVQGLLYAFGGRHDEPRTGFGTDRPTPRGQGVPCPQAPYSASDRYRGTASCGLQCLQQGRSERNVLVGANAAAATCPSFGRRPPLVDAATH